MTNGQIKLINHLWHECLNNHNGKALFNGNYLAKCFMGSDCDYLDIIPTLREFPDLKWHFFYIEGVNDKILEVAIDEKYCTSDYRRISGMLRGEKAFKAEFFSKLMKEIQI